MLTTTHRRTRIAIAIVLAAAVAGGSIGAAAPAFAKPKQKQTQKIDRARIMRRAKTWTKKGVSYSQKRWYKGYRKDCSGFVSMAWGLDASFSTYTLKRITRPIKKHQLRKGDVLLNASGGSDRHVVMFGGWANKKRTKYIVLEESGSKNRAVKRVMKYPYRVSGHKYKPRRWTGAHEREPGEYIKKFAPMKEPKRRKRKREEPAEEPEKRDEEEADKPEREKPETPEPSSDVTESAAPVARSVRWIIERGTEML